MVLQAAVVMVVMVYNLALPVQLHITAVVVVAPRNIDQQVYLQVAAV